MKIGVFVGSLRKNAYSLKVAKAILGFMPAAFEVEIIDISKLQIYNEDLEDGENVPEEWASFRNKVSLLDGFLFVTPEYNRSVPAALKNAIDVGSRPYEQSVWRGKPAAVISMSTGQLGGFSAHHHLRQTLIVLGVNTMPQPEAYVGNAQGLFDENGLLVNKRSEEFLKNFANEFCQWAKKFE